jgi:hypothetical protein
MRARRGGAAIALTAALLVALGLLAPIGASAAETYGYGPGAVTFAQVRASHGYRLNFSENAKGYFFVRVKGHGTTTDFALHAKGASTDHLVADFGKRGSFDLRFVPTRKPEPLSHVNWCKGKKGTWQVGFLVGTARFRTERGFAQIHRHRIPAGRETWSHMVCEYGHYVAPGHHKQQRTTLVASASSPSKGFSLTPPPRSIFFQAIQYYRHAKPADRRTEFVAELDEEVGRLSIVRRLAVASDEGSLLFPGAPRLPEEMTVKPPAPFSGSAEFLRTHESTFTWSGDLAVRFPGLDPIRLSGPHFEVGICNVKGCLLRHPEATSVSARYARAAAASTSMPAR